ncbi:MAG: lecithin retinol acyltransferase family protein [Oscillospiraceae bacterium]|nr:lecithin retinol acyltransferase family protein [Oscillospiraceae bacterium]
MIWRPGDCVPGDVIRVRLGELYHYGVFASEDEVIQFGLPPLPQYRERPDAFTVLSTDVDLFSCGQIVEIGLPEKDERRARFSREETLRRARARLGETGYDLLRNNCEHFVWDCAFGEKKCVQEQEARSRWRSRAVLDVYLAPLGAQEEEIEIASPERRRDLERTRCPETLRQRLVAWKTLEYAAKRSFGLDAETLHFQKNAFGRWHCEGMEFSLAHSEGMAVAAVSDRPVGVDVENIPVFVRRRADRPDQVESMLRRIRAPGEEDVRGAAALLWAWTGKESLFKAGQKGFFSPQRLRCGEETARFVLSLEPPVLLSVSGERLDRLRLYLCADGGARRLDKDLIRGGREALEGYFL